MTNNQDIQILDIKEISGFSHSNPEGVAVIMPCIDSEKGKQTAKILLRRAGMSCRILVVIDSIRQGFIKTLNNTAAHINVKYIVYLAQDAWPGRGWLKCAYEALEQSGKGLLAFNDGKWSGRIASFGMVRTDWAKKNYNGCIFYSGYNSHGADNELTVIARAQGMYVYNPECTLVEVDPDKDFGGSNFKDNALFKKRFLQGFDRLLPLDSLEPLAREYKVTWTPAASIVLPVCQQSQQINNFLDSCFKSKLQQPLELILIDQDCPEQAKELRAKHGSQALTRIIHATASDDWASIFNQAIGISRRNYLFLVKEFIICEPIVLAQAMHKLAEPKICATGICHDLKSAGSSQAFNILLCRKLDLQQLGGFDSGAKRGQYFDNILKNIAKKLGRNKLYLQGAQDKEDWKLLDVKQWIQREVMNDQDPGR